MIGFLFLEERLSAHEYQIRTDVSTEKYASVMSHEAINMT